MNRPFESADLRPAGDGELRFLRRLATAVPVLLLVQAWGCVGADDRPRGAAPPAAGALSANGQPFSSAPTVLITGSNRGIGLEFARQYAERGWRVIATARNPDGAEDLHALAGRHPEVVIEYLDVTDHEGIDVLAEKYRSQPIDVLINNAGVLGDREKQRLGSLDFEVFREVMAVNTYGPLRVAQAFLQHVASSEQRKIILITSVSGSIEVAGGGGGFYFYKVSKAGANMAMRTLNSESRNRGLNVRVGLIHPGTVNTRMLGEARGRPGTMEPEESVRQMIRVIDDLSDENAGTFLRYDGQMIPW